MKKLQEGHFYTSPIQPVELKFDSLIQFDCFKHISCCNACCRSIDIVITPYDIVRLKRRFKIDSKDLVGAYNTPYPIDYHDLTGLKLNTNPAPLNAYFYLMRGVQFMKIDLQLAAITRSAG